MLLELNVRDIALIQKASVMFDSGLNILTGETGTGKSVIIDSVMLALGAKVRGDMVRKGAGYGLVELIFSVEDERIKEALKSMEICPDGDGNIVITRRIMSGRSVSRINDETVTLSRLRDAASLLLDVYGQNEYHTLMDQRQHLRILDDYLAAEISGLKAEVSEKHAAWRSALSRLKGFTLDEQARLRELDRLSFETAEIENAALKAGEEEELSANLKRLSNARDILDGLGEAHRVIAGCDTGRAADFVLRAMRYDDSLKPVYDELLDAQSVLDSALSDISAYADNLDVDEQALKNTEDRLDLIRRLESKYGSDITGVLKYHDDALSRLKELEGYDEAKKKAESELKAAGEVLREKCASLSSARKSGAARLCSAMLSELKDLGFQKAMLSMEFKEKDPAADGYDDVRFMAALNPGEELKPLSEVASGGELSRVMLAVKTVLARTDGMPTLIFDEIDTGISGRTAQKVAEKLDVIGMEHQVICVSHLPQIAAMADTHFLITKTEKDGRNITEITRLDEEGSRTELARMLGGVRITDAVYENASEMKRLAAEGKGMRRAGVNS